MTTSIALNNTAPGITPSGCDGGLGTITTPVDIQMVVNGAVGSTPAISGSGVGLASITAIYYIGHTGDLNGQTIAAGTWTVPLDLASQSHPLTLDSIFIYRANSSGVAQATIGSSTGLSTALSTGTNGPFSVTGASATFATNEIVVISFQVHSGFNGTTLGVTPDQTVIAPAASGAGGVVPDNYFSRTYLPGNYFPVDHNFTWWDRPRQLLPPSASPLIPFHPGRVPLPSNYFPPDQTYIWWEIPRTVLPPSNAPRIMPFAVRAEDPLPLPALVYRTPVLYTPPVPGGAPPPRVIRSDFWQDGLVIATPPPKVKPQPMHPLQSQVLRWDYDEPGGIWKTPLLAPPVPGAVPPPRVIRSDSFQDAVLFIGKPMPVINPPRIAGGVPPPVLVRFDEPALPGVIWRTPVLPVAPASRQGTLILFYRGPYAHLPLLLQGEPAWTTDTGQMFVGTGTQNICVGGMSASAPASSSSPGYVGEWFSDGTWLYQCYAPNTWRRWAVSTF